VTSFLFLLNLDRFKTTSLHKEKSRKPQRITLFMKTVYLLLKNNHLIIKPFLLYYGKA